MKAINIKWDTDGDQGAFDFLPQEVTLPEQFSKENYLDESGKFGECEKNLMLEDISDWLSDEYGFCHGGFELSEEESEMVQTNIGEVPKKDYLDIKAMQYGFDDYQDMKEQGYGFSEED